MLTLDRFCVEIFRLALQGFSFTVALWLLDPVLLQLYAAGQPIPFILTLFITMMGIRFMCCLLVPVRKIADFRQRTGVLGAEMIRAFILSPIMIAYIWFQYESRALETTDQISMLLMVSYWIFITNFFILLFWFLYTQRSQIARVM